MGPSSLMEGIHRPAAVLYQLVASETRDSFWKFIVRMSNCLRQLQELQLLTMDSDLESAQNILNS